MNNIFNSTDISVSLNDIDELRVKNLSDTQNFNLIFGGDGLSSGDLKAHFDKIGIYLSEKLKNLVDGLKSTSASASIGAIDFEGEDSTIDQTIKSLSTSLGASFIGSTKLNDSDDIMTLQEIIDEIYQLFTAKKLNELPYIIDGLDYDDQTGSVGAITEINQTLTQLNDLCDKFSDVLDLNTGGTSTSLDNLTSDIDEINEMVGEPLGLATLNSFGRLAQNIDASHITQGVLPISVIPDCAFERTVFVDSQEELLALDVLDVQNGDIVVINDENLWYKVIDQEELGSLSAFREMVGGTTAISQMAREYDADFDGANSIASKFSQIETELTELDEAIQSALTSSGGDGDYLTADDVGIVNYHFKIQPYYLTAMTDEQPYELSMGISAASA